LSAARRRGGQRTLRATNPRWPSLFYLVPRKRVGDIAKTTSELRFARRVASIQHNSRCRTTAHVSHVGKARLATRSRYKCEPGNSTRDGPHVLPMDSRRPAIRAELWRFSTEKARVRCRALANRTRVSVATIVAIVPQETTVCPRRTIAKSLYPIAIHSRWLTAQLLLDDGS